MKILKYVIGVALLILFSFLMNILFHLDEKEIAVSPTEYLPTPLNNKLEEVKEIEIDSINELETSIFEYKAIFKDQNFELYFLDDLKDQKKIFQKGFKRILSSDLNVDQHPEFWLQFVDNKQTKFLGFQWEEGKLIPLNFPEIKGRQRFGYIGNDSLYLEKGLLVREFEFANDSFAEMANGSRKCYYTFGKDKSFILKKTIDYEK
ncbi:MAG: hypothetical protein RJA76_2152 [Bacteroidota bacterium]|jgi:hypothetical protein